MSEQTPAPDPERDELLNDIDAAFAALRAGDLSAVTRLRERLDALDAHIALPADDDEPDKPDAET